MWVIDPCRLRNVFFESVDDRTRPNRFKTKYWLFRLLVCPSGRPMYPTRDLFSGRGCKNNRKIGYSLTKVWWYTDEHKRDGKIPINIARLARNPWWVCCCGRRRDGGDIRNIYNRKALSWAAVHVHKGVVDGTVLSSHTVQSMRLMVLRIYIHRNLDARKKRICIYIHKRDVKVDLG